MNLKNLFDEEMTLRDWFAGQAMAGLLASNRAVSIDRDPHESISIASYAQADAMLAERGKGALTNEPDHIERKYFQKLGKEEIVSLAPDMYKALKGVSEWMQELDMDEDNYPRLAAAVYLVDKIEGRIIE